MAYEKQTWRTGDVVTSAKLNHMEDGIASGGVMVVNIVTEDPAQSAKNLLRGSSAMFLDKTWQEIYDALSAGVPCFCMDTTDKSGNNLTSFASVVPILFVGFSDDQYVVVVFPWNGGSDNPLVFSATSTSGYPST